jgi:hypothetical protein
MAKRIKVYYQGIGEPIEIWDQDLVSMEAKGWRTETPRLSKKKATVVVAETETSKEE